MDPDQPGALEAIAEFSRAGVQAAIGHTEATYETALAAFDAGATMLTHTFNAMPGVHPRKRGPIEAALDHDTYLELILDGIHVHPRVAAMLFQLAPGRVVHISAPWQQPQRRTDGKNSAASLWTSAVEPQS